jgi:hypothetical protein
MKTADCLIACPECKRWPMAINVRSRTAWGAVEVHKFVCSGCDHVVMASQASPAGAAVSRSVAGRWQPGRTPVD